MYGLKIFILLYRRKTQYPDREMVNMEHKKRGTGIKKSIITYEDCSIKDGTLFYSSGQKSEIPSFDNLT